MTRDMGPWARCADTGSLPPPQPFQYPLPPPKSPLPDMKQVEAKLEGLVAPSTRGAFVRLAHACASTFRQTDYLGGCDGARIRFAPEKDFPTNAGLADVVRALDPVLADFPTLSVADAIVAAGTLALRAAGGTTLEVCPGRSDALDGAGSEYLTPPIVGDANETTLQLHEAILRSGLTPREYVAVLGATRSLRDAWTSDPSTLDVEYFATLLDPSLGWTLDRDGTFTTSAKPGLKFTKTDLNVKYSPDLAAVAADFASDVDAYLAELAPAWHKLMNLDRFDASC